ncbi:MAG: twin transmembrane helix small protein [Gammaproteobacteria bacterium]|nr:twin transmembrane helix small protein [Gammaproteobacteria bacterium]
MLIKIVIVILFLLIIWNLASALFHLMVSKESNDKTVRALTYRIGLSVLAFVIIIISAKLGWIQPHGI